MNILIVDDLISVVNGLIKGIDWNGLGIIGVYKAHNAYEAKVLLNNLSIDILLTDIEMPGESGLDLVEWVREQRLDMECIFLSSHADFDYARRAIQMDSYEYVLLPCPYEEIMKVIRGAILKLNNKREQNKIYSYGKTVADDVWLDKMLFSNCLEKDKNAEAVLRLSELGRLSSDSSGFLCTLSITDQKIDIDNWDRQLLEFTLNNVITELLAPLQQNILFMQKNVNEYIFYCFNKAGFLLEEKILERQLELVKKTMQGSMRIETEIHFIYCEKLENMPDCYRAVLSDAQDESTAFKLMEEVTSENQWMGYFDTPWVLNLNQDVGLYLQKLDKNNENTQERRIQLHMDLVQLMYKYLDKYKDSVFYIFETREYFERYINAYKRSDALVWVAAKMTEYIKKRTAAEDDFENPVAMVVRYIQEHIGQDIKRSELADYVHLNIDYLSRIFKREKDITINDYIIMEKMAVAKNLLRTTRLPISLIATKVGYSNFSYFSKLYKKIEGKSPAEERE